MEDKRKNAVLEILNYWKITEFLGQTDIPQESSENKKLIKNIKNGKEVKAEKIEAEKIEVFFDLPVLSASDIDLEMILEKTGTTMRSFLRLVMRSIFVWGR